MRAIIVAACLSAVGCTTAPSTTGAALPPDLQRVLDDYTAAWASRDATAIAALFAEGRTVVPNACPPVTGAAEVERCYTGHGGPIHLRALDHAVSSGHAYIIGEYAEKPEDPAGGKFVLTLVEASGRWLIVADMDRPYGRGQPGPTPVPSGQP